MDGVSSVSYLPVGVYPGVWEDAGSIHAGGGKTKWKTAEDVYSWWMEEEQISLFDMPEWKNVNET